MAAHAENCGKALLVSVSPCKREYSTGTCRGGSDRPSPGRLLKRDKEAGSSLAGPNGQELGQSGSPCRHWCRGPHEPPPLTGGGLARARGVDAAGAPTRSHSPATNALSAGQSARTRGGHAGYLSDVTPAGRQDGVRGEGKLTCDLLLSQLVSLEEQEGASQALGWWPRPRPAARPALCGIPCTWAQAGCRSQRVEQSRGLG